MTERDPHNAFVSRLSVWIPLGLTQRGWLLYPERLSRNGLNNIIEDLWRHPENLTGLIDAESGLRIANLREQFVVEFTRPHVTPEDLDRWLLARFLPIVAVAEAYLRANGGIVLGESVTREPRTVPRRVQRLIQTLSSDPNALQVAPGGPRIMVQEPATQAVSQPPRLQASQDEISLSQQLYDMPTPSQQRSRARDQPEADDGGEWSANRGSISDATAADKTFAIASADSATDSPAAREAASTTAHADDRRERTASASSAGQATQLPSTVHDPRSANQDWRASFAGYGRSDSPISSRPSSPVPQLLPQQEAFIPTGYRVPAALLQQLVVPAPPEGPAVHDPDAATDGAEDTPPPRRRVRQTCRYSGHKRGSHDARPPPRA